MTTSCRLAPFLLFVAAGCAGNAVPPPEPVAENKPAALPNFGGGLIRGGSGEAPPPPPEPVREPEPGEIVAPKEGGVWPWGLAGAPEPRAAKPVTIPDFAGFITGMAVRPEADRAVVSIKIPRKKGDESEGTRVVWCDTAAGTVLAEWEVKDPWVVCDISPDGGRILVRSGIGHLPDDTLALWTVTDDLDLKPKKWKPHSTPIEFVKPKDIGRMDTSRNIAWARFVGSNRIVSSSHTGQLRVFEPVGLNRLGTIDAAPGRPTLTPDGKLVAFLVGNGVALLDPKDCTVLGARRIGAPPNPAALAFSPDAKTLAIAGHEKVLFLDLAEGDVWDGMFPKRDHNTPRVDESFGWAGEKYLFSDHYLYRPDLPIPAWDYGGVGEARCVGRQTWVLVKRLDKVLTLRPFELPHTAVEPKVASAAAQPGVFVLRPGDGIRIDVTGIPIEKQAEVRANLGQRLRQVGYTVDANGIATAVASLDAPKEASQKYDGHKAIPYTRQAARLKLVKDDKVLWETASASEPPSFAFISQKTNLTEFVQGYGKPAYSLYTKAGIPSVFLGTKLPLSSFGRSDLYADRIKEWR